MTLSDREIADALSSLPGWSFDGRCFTRQYTFQSFAFAVAFVTCLGVDADTRDHHPDMLISHRRVTVTWTSHDAGGVTARDVTGAQESDRLAAAMGHRD